MLAERRIDALPPPARSGLAAVTTSHATSPPGSSHRQDTLKDSTKEIADRASRSIRAAEEEQRSIRGA
jgi:hypothetical protein